MFSLDKHHVYSAVVVVVGSCLLSWHLAMLIYSHAAWACNAFQILLLVAAFQILIMCMNAQAIHSCLPPKANIQGHVVPVCGGPAPKKRALSAGIQHVSYCVPGLQNHQKVPCSLCSLLWVWIPEPSRRWVIISWESGPFLVLWSALGVGRWNSKGKLMGGMQLETNCAAGWC